MEGPMMNMDKLVEKPENLGLRPNWSPVYARHDDVYPRASAGAVRPGCFRHAHCEPAQ